METLWEELAMSESVRIPALPNKKDSAPACLRTSPGAVTLGKATSKHPVMTCADIGALDQET